MSQNLTNDSIETEYVPVMQEVRGVQGTGYKTSEFGWFNFKTELRWLNVITITLLHLLSLYALCTYWRPFRIRLTLWMCATTLLGGMGVTAGAHRLWTHRTYKANVPYRIIVMTCYLLAGMNSVRNWVRDHRVHHKYTESDADPHNSRRGFFFSHVGWLMMKKHPEVLRRGQNVDLSDLMADSVVQFQEKYFLPLKLLICFVLPVVIPVYMWNEDWYPSIISQWFIRYVAVLNFTWSVNSFAHIYGHRSYDKMIAPTENRYVSLFAMGEGWHNYHHVFPWDYKTAELGTFSKNATATFIDFFAKIGWVWDRKTASEELIKSVVVSRGDGNHPIWGNNSTDEMMHTTVDEGPCDIQRTKHH